MALNETLLLDLGMVATTAVAQQVGLCYLAEKGWGLPVEVRFIDPAGQCQSVTVNR